MSCRITGKICDTRSDVVGCGLVRCKFVEKKDGGKILNGETVKDCHQMTNADRIRAMSDDELAEFLTHINPTNCQDCAFSHGWRCQPDRDDYSDFEKCEEGRKRWLQQPAE